VIGGDCMAGDVLSGYLLPSCSHCECLVIDVCFIRHPKIRPSASDSKVLNVDTCFNCTLTVNFLLLSFKPFKAGKKFILSITFTVLEDGCSQDDDSFRELFCGEQVKIVIELRNPLVHHSCWQELLYELQAIIRALLIVQNWIFSHYISLFVDLLEGSKLIKLLIYQTFIVFEGSVHRFEDNHTFVFVADDEIFSNRELVQYSLIFSKFVNYFDFSPLFSVYVPKKSPIVCCEKYWVVDESHRSEG